MDCSAFRRKITHSLEGVACVAFANRSPQKVMNVGKTIRFILVETGILAFALNTLMAASSSSETTTLPVDILTSTTARSAGEKFLKRKGEMMPEPRLALTYRPELRLCKVGDELGYFHIWEQTSDVIAPSPMRGGHQGGVVAQMYALVEFADGVKRVQPYDVKFVDEDNEYLTRMNEMAKERDNDGSALNEFGRFLRAYRIQKGMLLYDMAKDLNVGSAFLSGCECSRHPIPEDWKDKLPALYPDLDADKLKSVISNNTI